MIRQVDKTQMSVNQDADVKRRLINVDSRFREDVRMDRERARVPATVAGRPDNQLSGSVSNFKYRLPTPVRNVTQMRVASVELPNTAQVISAAKRNNTLILNEGGSDLPVIIPDGNQDAATILTALSTAITDASPSNTQALSINPETGRLVWTTTGGPFTVTFRNSTIGYPNRAYNWGLGYQLGFRVDSEVATNVSGPTQTLSPASLVNFTGDNYQFLQINEENAVEHTTVDNGQVRAVAKIPIAVGNNTIAQEEFPGLLTNSVTFRTPIDVTTLQVRLVDAQGEVVDLKDVPLSFTLELMEVTNTYLQESRRKHITQDPANLS